MVEGIERNPDTIQSIDQVIGSVNVPSLSFEYQIRPGVARSLEKNRCIRKISAQPDGNRTRAVFHPCHSNIEFQFCRNPCETGKTRL